MFFLIQRNWHFSHPCVRSWSWLNLSSAWRLWPVFLPNNVFPVPRVYAGYRIRVYSYMYGYWQMVCCCSPNQVQDNFNEAASEYLCGVYLCFWTLHTCLKWKLRLIQMTSRSVSGLFLLMEQLEELWLFWNFRESSFFLFLRLPLPF